jgi:hypothetical protein
MTIFKDFAVLADLKKQYEDQQARIDALVDAQEQLSLRIRRASRVKEVTKDGIALDTTVAFLKREGGYASTVPLHDEDGRRTVDVYQKRGAHHKGWAVKVNSFGGFKEEFYGGKVLGLDAAWSKSKAARVAIAWLTFGKILEDQANDVATT